MQTTEERRLSPQGQKGRKEGDTKRAAQPLGKCRPTRGFPSSAVHQARGEVGAVGVPCVTSGTGMHPPTCACLLENVCKARSAPAPHLTLGIAQEKALKSVCFSGSQKQEELWPFGKIKTTGIIQLSRLLWNSDNHQREEKSMDIMNLRIRLPNNSPRQDLLCFLLDSLLSFSL